MKQYLFEVTETTAKTVQVMVYADSKEEAEAALNTARGKGDIDFSDADEEEEDFSYGIELSSCNEDGSFDDENYSVTDVQTFYAKAVEEKTMIAESKTYPSDSLRGIIIDALDTRLCGSFDNKIMDKYFPDFKFEDCESSLDTLSQLTELGAKAVEEGKITLNELLSKEKTDKKAYQLHLHKAHDMDLMQYDLKILAEEISKLINASSKDEPYTINISAKNITVEDIPRQSVLCLWLDDSAIEWLTHIPASKRSSFVKELLRKKMKKN